MTPDDGEAPLSISDAASLLAGTQPQPSEESTAEPEEEQVNEEDQGEQELLDGLTEEQGDTDEEDGDQSEEPEEEPEPEYRQGRFAAADAKVKLADGTVTTVAELMRGSLRDADYTQGKQKLSEDRKALEAQKAKYSELENSIAQQREVVAGLVNAFMPKPPDPKMLDPNSGMFDMVTYNMQKHAYEQNSLMVQQLINDHQQMLARQTSEKEEAERALRATEAEQLFTKVPELAKPENYQRFWAEAVEAAAGYGFTAEELDAISDHRQYLVLKDAMELRRLKAKVAQSRAKVEPGKPRVLAGSVRRSSEVVRHQEAKSAMERLDKTHSMKDGIKALLALEKAR